MFKKYIVLSGFSLLMYASAVFAGPQIDGESSPKTIVRDISDPSFINVKNVSNPKEIPHYEIQNEDSLNDEDEFFDAQQGDDAYIEKALQKNYDEQALEDKIIQLKLKYEKLAENSENDRNLMRFDKGSIIPVNTTKDALFDIQHAEQLLQVVHRYNELGNYYQDEYSDAALPEHNKELQYLLSLRQFMINSDSLPSQDDGEYTSEMKRLANEHGYSIKKNSMYADTLNAIDDRIVTLMLMRSRQTERVIARKNLQIAPKKMYRDEYSELNPELDAVLAQIDARIDMIRVNAEHGIISEQKAQSQLQQASLQRDKIMQERARVAQVQDDLKSKIATKLENKEPMTDQQFKLFAAQAYSFVGVGTKKRFVVKRFAMNSFVNSDLQKDQNAGDDNSMEEFD